MNQDIMKELADYGQSMWLDFISTEIIENGHLKSLIDNGLKGVTSNPSIFNMAITSKRIYDARIIELHKKGLTVAQIYDELTVSDIRSAADLLRPVYDQSNGKDGFVSLELSPLLAKDRDKSIAEGVRLHEKLDRPNVMLKVPATIEGLEVVEALLAKGININVTLIFSPGQYEATVRAYLSGINKFLSAGGDLSKVNSVASVFVSRIDTAVDKLLSDKNDKYRGLAAVANSVTIYNKYRKMFSSKEFSDLREQEANMQRVLWASTGTKNPNYSDIKYIAELIAPNTVNTAPFSTIENFMAHGAVKGVLPVGQFVADEVMQNLKECGVDMNDVFDKLLVDGLASFEHAFTDLLSAIDCKAKRLC